MKRAAIPLGLGLALLVAALAWFNDERTEDSLPDGVVSITPIPAETRSEPRAPKPQNAPDAATPAKATEAPRATDAGQRYAATRQGFNLAMRAAMPEIERCYDDWLKLQPALSGKLTVQFTIGAGRVTAVAVQDGGTGNAALEGCALSVVSSLEFDPSPDGPLSSSFPLAFVAPPVAPAALRPTLFDLCSRIEREARSAESQRVPIDDRLTVILDTIQRQTPDLKPFMSVLLPSDVPPLQRRRAFERGISSAIGTRWDCPEFERLWDGEP
jgi:hypothetical protein